MSSFRFAKPLVAIAIATLVTLPAAAGPGHGSNAQLLGEPGNARDAKRTLRIEMTENKYNLKRIDVKAGETIIFEAINKGTLVHEFSFAPPEVAATHRPEMAMMMEHGMITPDRVVSLTMTMPNGQKMDHTQPNSVLVEPGKTGRLVWKFTRTGVLEISCNIPGHYETGMVGELRVTR